MALVPVTAFYASLLGVYQVVLQWAVITARTKYKIALGDGGHHSSKAMTQVDRQVYLEARQAGDDEAKAQINSAFQWAPFTQVVRAHANFVESVPTALALFLLAELHGAPVYLLHMIGVILVVARLAHAEFGIKSKGALGPGRVAGTAGTIGSILILSMLNVALAVPHLLPYGGETGGGRIEL